MKTVSLSLHHTGLIKQLGMHNTTRSRVLPGCKSNKSTNLRGNERICRDNTSKPLYLVCVIAKIDPNKC